MSLPLRNGKLRTNSQSTSEDSEDSQNCSYFFNSTTTSENITLDSTVVISSFDSQNISIIQTENTDIETMASKFDINVALKLIPEFRGNRQEFHRFISCCDIIRETLGNPCSENDMTMLVNIIRSRLAGPAYNIAKHKNFNDWSSFKSFLQDQYLENRSIAQLQIDLINCKQNKQESVRSFANRIENLLSDLNDACIASEGDESSSIIINLNTKSAFKAFVEGLFYPIKLIVKPARYTKLSDAVEAAVEEERTYNAGKSSSSIPKINKNPKVSEKCNFCYKIGHTESECFQKQRQSRLPNFSRAPSNNIKPEVHVTRVMCSYCKKPGHHRNECFKLKKMESSRNNDPSQNSGNANTSSNSGCSTRLMEL